MDGTCEPLDGRAQTPATPVADLASELVLRPATDLDWGLVRRWLRLPAVEKWWGPSSTTEAEVINALGTSHAIARIIEWRGTSVGYAHAVDARTWGDDLPEDLEAGTWDMDIFIAEPAARGLGLGPAALAEMRSEVFSTTLATAVSVFISVENEAATRAYEKAGFRWRRIWQDPLTGPVWLLVSDRPPA